MPVGANSGEWPNSTLTVTERELKDCSNEEKDIHVTFTIK